MRRVQTPIRGCDELPINHLAILRGRMAVPKKKTSKSRRDKRRAQHGIESPRVNVCPTCGQPKRPHRVCPNCKTYKGREVEPLRTPVP
jgi:large subunit ribosomal protein L32